MQNNPLLDFINKSNQISKATAHNLHKTPWIEKYRPSSLDNIISHKNIISVLKKFIQNKDLPHLFFFGPAGSGKTSTVIACSNALYGQSSNVMAMELNASDERGIEVVRTKIKQFVNTKNIYCDGKNDLFKLVILDEIDSMTSDAQAILRKIIEKYTRNARFCLICNDINKVSQALHSRCVPFRFAPLNNADVESKILQIATLEKVNITPDGINTIIKRSNGDMRMIINTLQSASMSFDILNEQNINKILSYPCNTDICKIIKSLINDTFNECREILEEIKIEYGLSLTDIIREIHLNLLNYMLDNKKTEINIYIKKLDDEQIMQLFKKLSDVEYNLSICTSESLQIFALIGIFHSIR